MSNGLAPGSGGAPPYTSVPRISAIPRRSSYASVVAGADATQHFNHPTWSSTLSNLTNANVNASATTPSNSYPPHPQQQQLNPDTRSLQRSASAFQTEMQSNGVGGGIGPLANPWRRSTPLPAYSAQFASLPEYGGGSGSRETGGADSFFTPSYLKGSKYMSQLAASHKVKAAAASQKESSSSSNPPSLSSSSSHVNLPRMAPSHRGMTYDIIENPTTKDENVVRPLPSAWNEADKYALLDIHGDGLELRYQGQTLKNGQEAATARANHPIPPQCGLYYFEITVLGKPKDG